MPLDIAGTTIRAATPRQMDAITTIVPADSDPVTLARRPLAPDLPVAFPPASVSAVKLATGAGR